MTNEEIQKSIETLIPPKESKQVKAVWPRPYEEPVKKMDCGMRVFDSGATRDHDDDKPDYDACLSPLVLETYAEYILACSYLPDGTRRASDNWKKGLPLSSFMQSAFRHFIDVWKLHQGFVVLDKRSKKPITLKHALCALLFNVMGYLHTILEKENDRKN